MTNAFIEIPEIGKDGRLYHRALTDTVEALIPNSPYESCHAADLLELPNGDLLCAWFAGSDEGNADISIVASRLKAGENRWSAPRRISDDDTRSEQNPSLFLHPNGEIWAMYTAQVALPPEGSREFNLQYTAEIRRRISRDMGETWGPTEVMFSRPGSFCRQKIQMLSSGRWIFGNWICLQDDSHCGSDVTVLMLSDDEGKTWREAPMPESRGRVHANVLEIAPRRLVALLRSRSADRIYRSVSEDDGEHWTAPQPTCLRNNNSSISAIRLKSGALALAYNDVAFNDDPSRTVWPKQRCPVTLAISEDGGVTWPYRRIVEPGEGFTGPWNDINNRRYEYPVIMQDTAGNIHVAYSWGNRRQVKHVVVNERWIRGEATLRGAEGDPSMPCQR